MEYVAIAVGVLIVVFIAYKIVESENSSTQSKGSGGGKKGGGQQKK